MQRLFFYWINYTLLILFIVMVILGVVQLAVKKESEITFYTTFFGIIFGISFMSAYYANKKSNRMFFWLTTFLLMYVPKCTFVKDFGSKLFYSAVRHTDTNFFPKIY